MELGEGRRYKTGDCYMLKRSMLMLTGMTLFLAESCEGGECEWVVEGRRDLVKREVILDRCAAFCMSLYTSLCGHVISCI